MKKKLCLSLCLAGILLMGGCYEEEVVRNELLEGTTAVISGSTYGSNQTSVVTDIPVRGEDFSLRVLYDTNDLLLNDWRVTSNKELSMEVTTVGLPEGYKVYVEHVHADMLLKSTNPRLDGICHDSMDDSDHRIPTKGFEISDVISYHNIFSIEGYNCEFYEIWGYSMEGLGYTDSTYSRLSEKKIRDMGCYAEKLAVVYDIVIVRPDGSEYVRSVYSDVLIPLIGDIDT